MKVLLVDDHAIVRAGLRRLFTVCPDVRISEAATGREALALVIIESDSVPHRFNGCHRPQHREKENGSDRPTPNGSSPMEREIRAIIKRLGCSVR